MWLNKENENLRNHKDLKESFAKSCSAQNPTQKNLNSEKSCRGGGELSFKINWSKMLQKNLNLVILEANQQRRKKGVDAAECSTAVYQDCDSAPRRICLQSVINEKQGLLYEYIIVCAKTMLGRNSGKQAIGFNELLRYLYEYNYFILSIEQSYTILQDEI